MFLDQALQLIRIRFWIQHLSSLMVIQARPDKNSDADSYQVLELGEKAVFHKRRISFFLVNYRDQSTDPIECLKIYSKSELLMLT